MYLYSRSIRTACIGQAWDDTLSMITDLFTESQSIGAIKISHSNGFGVMIAKPEGDYNPLYNEVEAIGYKYDRNLSIIELPVEPFFLKFEIPGICRVSGRLLYINSRYGYKSSLIKALFGVYAEIHYTDNPEVNSPLYTITHILGVTRDTINFVTNPQEDNALPSTPREPMDVEKALKGLFSDKMTNVIMKRVK